MLWDLISQLWLWLCLNWYWIKWALLIWIIFSAFLVTIICMNSSRLNRVDEPFKDPSEIERTRRK